MLDGLSLRSQLVHLNSCTQIELGIVTFECSVCDRGATVWTGSLFDCLSKSNEITLRHNQFESGSSTSGDCNNGAVVAHSTAVLSTNNTDCYISQLMINISMVTDVNNKTVTCRHVDDTSETVVDTVPLSFITGIYRVK